MHRPIISCGMGCKTSNLTQHRLHQPVILCSAMRCTYSMHQSCSPYHFFVCLFICSVLEFEGTARKYTVAENIYKLELGVILHSGSTSVVSQGYVITQPKSALGKGMLFKFATFTVIIVNPGTHFVSDYVCTHVLERDKECNSEVFM